MWCAREDLNLQSFRNQILSLARLPFRHARVRNEDGLEPNRAQERRGLTQVAIFSKSSPSFCLFPYLFQLGPLMFSLRCPVPYAIRGWTFAVPGHPGANS